MKKWNIHNSLSLLFLLSVVVLSMNKIQDSDAWMHLSLGRQIWQSRGLPATEPLVYTSLGLPFSYSSWFFGLTYYLSSLAMSIYGVILLKTITVVTTLYILLKDSLRPYKNHVVSILVLTIVVMMARHRFVERPDTFMMLFLSFSIFSLNAFIEDNKKYIYALPLVHLLWANSHSSIPLMFIPFIAFIAGGFAQKYAAAKNPAFPNAPSGSQIKTIALIFAASFAASLISPYFINQYLFSAPYLASPWFKQEILELRPPTWDFSKWPYLMSLSIVLSFILNRKRISLVHLFLIIPFMALSFSAARFIFLLGIIAGPVLTRNIASFLAAKAWGAYFFQKPAALLLVAWLVGYSVIALANPEQEPGFGIRDNSTCEQTLAFMDMQGIRGRIFNLFEWGGYINWRDFPARSVFVDPRGAIPNDLLESLGEALYKPAVLDGLEKRYGFESVLTTYLPPHPTQPGDLIYQGLSHPSWALVYWDDQSLLYLKRGGRYDALIRAHEYQYALPDRTINRAGLHDRRYYERITGELERNVRETQSYRAHVFLGAVYNETGQYQKAIEALTKALEHPLPNNTAAYLGKAFSLKSLGNVLGAIESYKHALAISEDATTYYNIATLYLQSGDDREALSNFEAAIKHNPNLASAYLMIANIYRKRGMNDSVSSIMEKYAKAEQARDGEQHFNNGLAAYGNKQYEVAISEFNKFIETSPASPLAFSNIGYMYFDMGNLDKAFAYHKKALDIDPNCANAYYGLALIYKKWGDAGSAKENWEKYLNIEPAGYFSRKALEEIRSLGSKS